MDGCGLDDRASYNPSPGKLLALVSVLVEILNASALSDYRIGGLLRSVGGCLGGGCFV